MMYPSTMFRVHGVDPVRAGDAWNHFSRLMEEAEAKGRTFARKAPIIRPQKNPAEWRANVTQLANADGGPVDGTNALQLSAAEVEGRRQIVDFFRFLREIRARLRVRLPAGDRAAGRHPRDPPTDR
jgi:hypothetical protein